MAAKSPDQISGLIAWWHANDVALSGSDVETWPDQSGNGFTLSKTGTVTFDATDKGVVFPNSTSSFLFHASALGFVGNPAMTIAARLGDQPNTVVSTDRWLHVGGNSGASGTARQLGVDFSTRYDDGAKGWSDNPIAAAGYNNFILTHPSGGGYTASELYFDGSLASVTGLSNGASTVNMTDDAFTLGASDGSSPNFAAQVTIKEIAVFDRVLTSQEITDLDLYLADETMGSLAPTGDFPAIGSAILSALQPFDGR